VLRRWRLRRTHAGTYRFGLADEERAILRQLLPQLRELVQSRVEAIDRVEASLDSTELTEEELIGWIQSVNAVRLVLGTMLDVSEDEQIEDVTRRFSPDDPALHDYALYGYLSALLDEMVSVLGE